MVDLSICILTFDHCKMLNDCLDSIYKTTLAKFFEIIIVDSGSKDGTIEMIKSKYPEIKLIKNSKFSGFSSGNNQAFCQVGGRYVMILNDDTLVLPNAFAGIIKYMDSHPKIGAIGPKLLNPDMSHQYSSYLSFPTLKTDLITSTLQLSWLMNLFKKSSEGSIDRLDHYGIRNGNQEGIRKVKHLMGACILVRKEILQEVGALDEHFFLSLEDQDWCKRIGDTGWDVIFYPESKVIHLGNQTIKNLNNFGKIYFQSRSYFQRKHYGMFSLLFFKFFTLIIAINNFLVSFLLYLGLFYSDRKKKYRSIMSHSINTVYWVLGGKNERVQDMFKN